MNLNADLGESFGVWKLGNNHKIMPLIDQANIACGSHAGDPMVIQSTIALAIEHDVTIGAHVSYPDLQGFGRRSMRLSSEELYALVHMQLSIIDGMAKCQRGELKFVKPHGALYNDMMKDMNVYKTIVKAVSSYPKPLFLVIQAIPQSSDYQKVADALYVELMFEAFVDRAYDKTGLLVPRSKQGAVLSVDNALNQAHDMITKQAVKTVSGHYIQLKIDTLCIHSESPGAAEMCQALRKLISD